jgi:hypothetical protein
MEWLGGVISAIKNAGPLLYFAAFIASAALLFLPDNFIVQLGLDQFRQTYRSQAGIVFIASGSLLAAYFLFAVWRVALSPWHNMRLRRSVYQKLTELTDAEKAFLGPFIIADENTVFASINDGIAGGLQAKGLIYRSSNISHGFDWPYNLQPITRRVLKEHPELLI